MNAWAELRKPGQRIAKLIRARRGTTAQNDRLPLQGPNHLRYEATLTDPDVYERPWTLGVLLYRNMDLRAQLLDFKCVEFVEERMYGELTREKPDA